MDLTMKVKRLPRIGETIHGSSIDYLMGGKGANQAVAASRVFDGQVSMIGCLGKDTFGDKILKHLSSEKLDLSRVQQNEAIFTGMASIFKTEQDNAIVVIPGANEWCDKELIERNRKEIETADILLMQLEIPIETVTYAASIAKQSGTTVILNPAPFYDLSRQLLYSIDYITPNDSEFEGLYGSDLKSASDLEMAMIEWQKEYPGTRLIVTRGEQGVSYVENGKVVTIKAREAMVVDTTGAGDTFNGVLAVALVEGKGIDEAILIANTGAALAIQKFGAQTGMPTKEELDACLGQ